MTASIMGPKKATKGRVNDFWVLMLLLLAAQEASCLCLEGDDDDGQFEVSLLFQLSQNSRPEEHFALTDTIQVRVQIQVLYLETRRGMNPASSFSQ